MPVFVRETGASYRFTETEYQKKIIIICSLSLHIYFSQSTAGRLPASFGAAESLVSTRAQGRKDGAESVITENKTRVAHKRGKNWGSVGCERERTRGRRAGDFEGEGKVILKQAENSP